MMKVAKKQSLTEKATNGFEYVHHMKEDEPLLGGKAGAFFTSCSLFLFKVVEQRSGGQS